MIVGTLELSLRLDGCFSLKDKRRVLRSLMEKIRRDFQVAISEVDDNDLWNVATLGVATVSNNAQQAESQLQHVVDVLDATPEVVVEAALKDIQRT